MLAGQLLDQDCPKRPLLRPRAMTSWGHLVLGHDIPPMFKKKNNRTNASKNINIKVTAVTIFIVMVYKTVQFVIRCAIIAKSRTILSLSALLRKGTINKQTEMEGNRNSLQP